MILIKKATIKDASDYAYILNRSWKDTYGEYISYEHIDDEFNIEKLIDNFSEYICNHNFDLYMISVDGKNIGIIEIGSYEDKYKDNMEGIGEIRSFHIKQEFQNQGIGSEVLKFAVDELKKMGYRKICLWVKKQNTKAIKFYEKHGFKKTVYDCEETIDGAPSMVMEKSIKER